MRIGSGPRTVERAVSRKQLDDELVTLGAVMQVELPLVTVYMFVIPICALQ